MRVFGRDPYSGGRRTFKVVADGPLVQFSAEGIEGYAEITFTPDQVMAMIHELAIVARQAAKATQVEGEVNDGDDNKGQER